MPEYNQNRPQPISNSQGGGKQNFQRRDEATSFAFSKWETKIKKWVCDKIDNDTIEFADEFGRHLKENELSTSQIRIPFGEMRKIQMNGFEKETSAFLLLKAKLAYAAKRHKEKKGVEELYQLFVRLYDAVNKEDITAGTIHFKNLLNVMEAVLAYHKYHGGKEN